MPREPLIFVYGTLYIVFKLIIARECLVCVQSFYVQAFLIYACVVHRDRDTYNRAGGNKLDEQNEYLSCGSIVISHVDKSALRSFRNI